MSFKIKIFTLTAIFLFVGSNVFALTFGYQGGDIWGSQDLQNNISGSKFYLPDYAEIQSMSAWIDFWENGEVKVGIYDSNLSLVAESNPIINASGNMAPVWFDFTFPENPILESGNYWLVAWSDTFITYIGFENNGTPLELWQKPYTYNGFPESFSNAVFVDTRNGAIYATYEIYEEPPTPILILDLDDLGSILGHVEMLTIDVMVVMMFAIGLPLGFWVIDKVIELVSKG
jgi:hypothetical protein